MRAPDPPAASLAARLREATAGAHATLEAAARLPEGIATLQDYAICLGRFHSVVAPLEAELRRFAPFAELGIDLGARARGPLLRADLAALGVPPPAPLGIPPLQDFPAALGALYVLEGSALGGIVILRALTARFGDRLAGATAFFGTVLCPWAAFKARLDRFGQAAPEAWPSVIAGAVQTFACHARALGGF